MKGELDYWSPYIETMEEREGWGSSNVDVLLVKGEVGWVVAIGEGRR